MLSVVEALFNLPNLTVMLSGVEAPFNPPNHTVMLSGVEAFPSKHPSTPLRVTM